MDFNHQIRGGSARLVDGSADLPDVAAEDIAFEKSKEECMVVIVRHKDQEDEATIEKRKKKKVKEYYWGHNFISTIQSTHYIISKHSIIPNYANQLKIKKN